MNAADGANHSLDKLEANVKVELHFVSLANTVAGPGAVVVMGGDTLVARFAMFSPQWNLQVADCAVLKLNERQDIGLFVFLFDNVHLLNSVVRLKHRVVVAIRCFRYWGCAVRGGLFSKVK